MKQISRRIFLRQGTLAAGATAMLSQLPHQLFASAAAANIPIGFQTWSVKEELAGDFEGTLKKMSGLGYKLLEMCSHKGYENAGFGPLLKMTTAEMRNIIEGNGLSCPSSHFGLNELTDHLDDRIAFAKELGLTEMICS